MRKIVTVIICSLLITSFVGIFSIQTSVADPTTIYVDDDNTVGPWDGTQENPYQFIQDGIDNATNPGDIIYVYHGTYVEQINVTKSLTLEGENKSNTTVVGGFNVTQNTTTIRDFTINAGYRWDLDGGGVNGAHRAGIRVNSSYNTFYNNDIYDIFGENGDDDPGIGGTGGSGTGIYVDSSSAGDISQNTIDSVHGGTGGGGIGSSGRGGNCTGIYLNASTGINITQNTIDDLTGGDGGNADPGGNGGTSVGIFLETTTNTNITLNTITNITGGTGGTTDTGGDGGTGAGIYLKTSTETNVTQNTITIVTGGSGGGNVFGGDGNYSVGIYLQSSANNNLINNTISEMINGTGGLGSNSNGIDGMGVGLYGSESDDNTIMHCTATYGYTGVSLISSTNNLCYDNYFSNNSYNAYDDGDNTWNIVKTLGTNIIGGSYLGGNYWSNYSGVDGDVDGFGDTPYNIPGGANQDELPLMNQPPNTPNSPNPADNATDISVDVDLSWSGGDPDSDTVTYDMYFGTVSPPPKKTGNQSGTTYDPGTMNHDTEYYWKIVAWDSNGATASGLLWNFTTKVNNPPDAPSGPDPSNNSTVIPVNADLSWTGGDPDPGDTVTYDVYFGTVSPPPKVSSNLTDTTYDTGTMEYDTTYYWKIISWDDHNATNASPLWNFNTTSPLSNPPAFTNQSPANGQTDISVSLSVLHLTIQDFDGDTFNWTIITSPNVGNSSGFNANNGTKNCSIIVTLAYSTTYTWYVTAYDGVYWTNKTYSFTTTSGGGAPPGPQPPAGPQNKIPVANTSAGEPYKGYVNSEILFDGSKSYDPDGNITKWLWVFGDNTNGTEKTIRHTYLKPGTYTVTLTVTDNDGVTNSDTTSCLIKQQNRPPTKPIVTGPTSGTKNTLYTYTAFSTDADNNTIRYTFDWGESVSQSSGFLPNATSYTMNHSWTAAGRYSVTITVTDNLTESSSNITMYIDAVQTRGVGYLLDNDGDGVYDAFYSEESKQTITTIQKKDGSYFIDSDGDGDWEYRYNATNGFTDYRESRKTPGFEIIVIIGAIALVMFWRRKRRDSD